MNKYHAYLTIDAPFTFPSFDIPDPTINYHFKINRSMLANEFVEWIYERDLVLRDGDSAGEYFYTPPNGSVPMHTDKHEINDYTKLNWLVGGESSVMNWYELKPGKTLSSYEQTNLKTSYAFARPEDVDLVYSARIGTPSLVNVGRLHSLTNGPEASHVYCVYVDDPQTGKRLSWNQALHFFVDCIKK